MKRILFESEEFQKGGIDLAEIEMCNSLQKWMDKWEFIIVSDHELSRAGAKVAISQLDVIVSSGLSKENQRA